MKHNIEAFVIWFNYVEDHYAPICHNWARNKYIDSEIDNHCNYVKTCFDLNNEYTVLLCDVPCNALTWNYTDTRNISYFQSVENRICQNKQQTPFFLHYNKGMALVNSENKNILSWVLFIEFYDL